MGQLTWSFLFAFVFHLHLSPLAIPLRFLGVVLEVVLGMLATNRKTGKKETPTRRLFNRLTKTTVRILRAVLNFRVGEVGVERTG